MVKVLSFFLIILFFVSCSDKKENTTPVINFNGITSTDANGSITQSIDPSDWNLTDIWNESEKSLFDYSNNNFCEVDDFNYIITAFPNPCNGAFSFFTSIPDNSNISFRIVDRNYDVIMSKDNLSFKYLSISTQELNIYDTLRIYYKIEGIDCVLKGHGDIVIKK